MIKCVLRKASEDPICYRYEFSDGALLLSGEKFGAIFGPDGTKIWEGDMRGPAPDSGGPVSPAVYQHEANHADIAGVQMDELTPEEIREIDDMLR